ncbi:NAD-P-binding protein [Gymnopilus junonius]|uniref:NAD-P-binding protein n=1 Tax=Gymnopilus junonius TaxID=109634 RepID=A0A9P5TFK0_GYMJU|nr:NAD-P-binding protein [Gymnopilus junonius]
MPTVEPSGSRVLVTGANGYIAMWVIRVLLEQGYMIRGVVRSLEKGKHIKEYFSSYGDKMELFVVEDMAKEGAFDDAVKDVDAIEHLATLVTLYGIDPDEYIRPALHGTLGVLQSALKFGQAPVKRIIITSSVAAIYNPVTEHTGTVTFDETSWGDENVEVVKEKGRDAGPIAKYSASKTLAEKAAWDFYKKHKNEIKWDMLALHPPFVFGPTLQKVKKPDDMNASMKNFFWDMITKEMPDDVLQDTFSFVDVRDVADAHVLALKIAKAAGERIVIANKSSTWQGLRDLIQKLQPQLYTSGILPRGKPDLDQMIKFKYNADKGTRILGMQYISEEKMVSDVLADFKARGWLEKRADALYRKVEPVAAN